MPEYGFELKNGRLIAITAKSEKKAVERLKQILSDMGYTGEYEALGKRLKETKRNA